MNEILKKLQTVQIEILSVIDNICREYDIHYSLYAGTMIGAVRHQGFIPWDDDLDICMSRKEYDRFVKLWGKISPKGYVLQNKYTSPGFSQSFTKIRKDHTTFLQEKDLNMDYHTGIFVDIFPVDRMPTDPIRKNIFKWDCLIYQLYMREFVPSKGSKMIKCVSKMILKLTPLKQRVIYRKKFEKKLRKYNENTKFPVVFIEVVSNLNTLYPANILDEYVDMNFEGKKFMCFAQWDLILKKKYSDYMKFPPKEERVWKHQPLIIDFHHNYEEIKDDTSVSSFVI